MTSSFKSKVVSGLFWSGIGVWGNRLGGILIFFVLARLLTPQDFGVYAAVWAILLFVQILSELGLGDALIQRKEVERELLNTVFAVNLLFALAICASIWILAPRIAGWMGMPGIDLPLQIASLALVFNALGFCQLAMSRREFAYRWLAMRTLVATLVSGALGIGLALAGMGVWALIVQFLAMAMVNMIMLWFRPRWRPGLQFSASGLAQLMRYSGKLTLARLLEATSTRAFELAIGAWMGAVTLGLYSVGSRIYSISMQLLSSMVLDVAHVGFSRLAAEKAKFLQAYYMAVTATAALVMPIFILMAALAEEICEAIFGARWGASAPVLQLLALLGAVQSVQYCNGAARNALGLMGLSLLMTLVRALVTAVVLALFHDGELNMLVRAFVFGQLLVSPLAFVLGKQSIGFRWGDLGARIWPFVFAAGMGYLAVVLLGHWWPQDLAWLRLLAGLLAGAGAYALTALALARETVFAAVRMMSRNSERRQQ